MENPFLQLKKANFKLKLFLGLMILGVIGTYYGTSDYLEEKHQRYIILNEELRIDQEKHEAEMLRVKAELKAKEQALKKYNLTKKIISGFIKDNNNMLSDTQAEKYAVKIIQESNKRGHSPYVQAALLASESSFKNNPKHDIRTVIGMGGIYYDVWSKALKQEKIAYSIDSLRNPYVNIEASAYVISYYNNCANIRTALAKYKGYCALGKSQANNVMVVAIKLKKSEKELNV
jgi:hypothetical protein